MVRFLCERLGLCEDRLFDLVRKGVTARLASLVLKFSEYQDIVVSDGSRKIPIRLTHQELGNMIGADREAVTRAFVTLRQPMCNCRFGDTASQFGVLLTR